LQDIPENATKEWREAFIGLCEEVIYYQYSDDRFSARQDRGEYDRNLAEAKEEAKRTLVRLKGTDEEKQKLRREAITHKFEALRAEAAMMGIQVTGEVA